ncbi:MAG: hypothetical protein RL328_14 [Acidobacteriota bacterium]|jgi:DNA-binding beta-propeller fold protein YncE
MRRSSLLLLFWVSILFAQAPPALRPGALTDGSELLPTGWRIQPAGKQVALGTFPLNSALSPDGKFLATAGSNSVSVVRLDSLSEVSRTSIPEAWQGITFSADGRNLYVGGGARNSVFEYLFSPDGKLALVKEMPGPAAGGFIGDLAIPPAGRLVYAADLFHDEILVFNPQSGRVIDRFKSGRRPYQILFSPDGKTYFVSSWADASVFQYRTNTGEEIGRLRLAPHPTAMVLSDRKLPDDQTAPPVRIFVAAAGTNNIYVIGVDRNDQMKQIDQLNIGFAPGQPAGMTPTGLSLSKDQTQLFVACANVNAVAVADISEARSRLAGFLPVGAYPASVRTLPDGRVATTNAHSDSLTVVANDPALTAKAVDLVAYDPKEVAPAAPAFDNVVLVTLEAAKRGANFAKYAGEYAAVENFFPNAPGKEGLAWVLGGMPSDFAQRLRGKNFNAADITNQSPAGTLTQNARLAGLAPNRLTVVEAASDEALGKALENLPAKTVAFVVGDQAPLLVVSPNSRKAPAPSGMFYNDSSVVRTIELILKLRPVTVFDASARPLTELFTQ